MKSSLKFDEFFVTVGSRDRDRRFSILGLQFLSEFVTKAVEIAGLDPSQVIIRVGESKYVYDTISLSWPTQNTTLISGLTIRNEGDTASLVGSKRKPPCKDYKDWGRIDKEARFSLLMADPEVQTKLADLIKISLPKKSKFVENK